MTFGIESSNIVGYTQKDVEQAKYVMYAPQFVTVDSGAVDLSEIMSGVPGTDWDEDGTYVNTAAILQIFNGTKYTTYYYLNDGAVSETETAKGWCDAAGDIAEIEFTPGMAAWLRFTPASSSVTAAGAVDDSDEVTIDCAAGYTMCANAFPVALSLNGGKMIASGIVGADWDEDGLFVNAAPMIQIFDGSKYVSYYYLNDGAVSETETAAGWCDAAGDIVDVAVPVGTGFWVNAKTGPFTLKFSK